MSIENNIFGNAKTSEFMHAPSYNAFDSYQIILDKALEIDKEKLIIAILGPTSKILTYDLAQLGYRVLDLGHIAKDYDAFVRQIPRTQETIGKFFEPD